MDAQTVAQELAKKVSVELLGSDVPARFAYTALDGDARVVPVAFDWDGERITICTVPKSAKVAALRKNPRVAITIDTQGFPPQALLVRGAAELELVDGVPQEYLDGSRKLMTAEQYEGWAAGVQALYAQMVTIVVTPDWVKLLDFETTIPKAVADLVASYGDPR